MVLLPLLTVEKTVVKSNFFRGSGRFLGFLKDHGKARFRMRKFSLLSRPSRHRPFLPGLAA
jgi:hypothetical protein